MLLLNYRIWVKIKRDSTITVEFLLFNLRTFYRIMKQNQYSLVILDDARSTTCRISMKLRIWLQIKWKELLQEPEKERKLCCLETRIRLTVHFLMRERMVSVMHRSIWKEVRFAIRLRCQQKNVSDRNWRWMQFEDYK